MLEREESLQAGNRYGIGEEEEEVTPIPGPAAS
jgi:hypothetical protein